MTKKKPFCLFLKKLANGREIYYYTAYDFDGKRRQFSTGSADQMEAYQICLDRLKEGRLVPTSKILFERYTRDWFTEHCPYYSPRMEKGRGYSRSSIENKSRILHKHILPYFGEKRLDFIQTNEIEDWLHMLKNAGYAVNSINQYLAVLRLVFTEAVRTGTTSVNPVKNVLPYTEHQKEKGILTEDESKRLFSRETVERVWNGNTLQFLISYTAFITGMRQGECLALTSSCLHDTHIHVKYSWDRKYGLKSTKSGKERYVPIPPALSLELKSLAERRGGRFVFAGSTPFKPVDYKAVQKYLNRAMENIGIDEGERKKRRLSFHSFRHGANTRMKAAGIPDAVVRSIIGHILFPDVRALYAH